MNKRYLFSLLLLLIANLLHAQAKTDTISFKKRWLGGYRYIYDDRKINSVHQLSKIVRDDPAAFKYLKKTRHARIFEESLWLADLIFIDVYNPHTISRHSADYLPDLPIVTTIAVLAIDIPVTEFALKNEKRAVHKYNSDAQKTGYIERRPQLYLTAAGAGLGIGLKF